MVPPVQLGGVVTLHEQLHAAASVTGLDTTSVLFHPDKQLLEASVPYVTRRNP